MIEGMGASEIGVIGAVSIYVIKELIGLVKGMIPVTRQYTEADIKEMEHKTNLTACVTDMKGILLRLSDKGDDRERILDDINSTGERTHKTVGKISDNISVLTNLVATGDFCNAPKGNNG